MSEYALRLLRQDRRLAELAAHPFDFDLGRAAHGHVEEVRLASGGPLEVVAGDGTGGTYFVCADGSVLYADSEGAAGIIGSSADEALELVIGLPGWRDYTHLSPDDGEEKILARVAETEDEIREYYGIDEERAEPRRVSRTATAPRTGRARTAAAALASAVAVVAVTGCAGFEYREDICSADEYPAPSVGGTGSIRVSSKEAPPFVKYPQGKVPQQVDDK